MNNKNLRVALKSNAGFSLLSGLSLVFFNESLARVLNIPQPLILVAIGVGLVLFSLLVYKTGNDTNMAKKMVQFIIVQDWLWVVGSILLIATQAFGISQIGFIIIGVIALIVAGFATFQQRYLNKM